MDDLKKITGHLFYTTSNSVHNFKVIGEFTIECQFGNFRLGLKWVIYFAQCDLKMWPSKSIGPLVHTMSSFVHHFKAIGEFKLELQSGNIQFPSDLEIRRMTLNNNGASLPWHLKICASFCSHRGNSNWCPKTPNMCQNRRLFVPCDLEIWQITLKNNRSPPLNVLCASFRSHCWIQG